jgi:hypothetical protein
MNGALNLLSQYAKHSSEVTLPMRVLLNNSRSLNDPANLIAIDIIKDSYHFDAECLLTTSHFLTQDLRHNGQIERQAIAPQLNT